MGNDQPSELRRLLDVFENEAGWGIGKLFPLLRALVTRLDALTEASKVEPYPFIVALRTERDEARAKLAEAERERDEAMNDLRRSVTARDEALTVARRCADEAEARRTAAESALAVERKVSAAFRAACPSVVGEDRRTDGSVRACFFGEVLGNCESRLAIACLGYDDSRRRATTGGEKAKDTTSDAAYAEYVAAKMAGELDEDRSAPSHPPRRAGLRAEG